MSYTINDEVYKRISKKVEDGIFKKGKNCKLSTYYFERKTIMDFPISERTPEICVSLMNYGKCDFHDVPETSRTRDFFISAFTNHGVFNYIKDNIEKFDRDFFKDLLESNEYATHFDRNCFAIMPLEYIDEEMCSLAILKALDWSDTAWFYSTYERKPEALTSDIWKLGARLYARKQDYENEFLSITPEEYKDEEYYKEMCSCNYNCGMELTDNKGKIMDSVPQELLTPKFLLELLSENLANVARFNETALETEISYTRLGKEVQEKIWQFVVKKDGYNIRYIELNDERIEYFLNHYDKDSHEYNYGFKDKYKKYKKKKENSKAYAEQTERAENYYRNAATLTFLGAYVNALNGEEPTKAIDDVANATRNMGQTFLPIKYRYGVPLEFCKKYDPEEYLEMMYKLHGIEIIEEYDDLFYRVNIPEGWTVTNEGYWNYVKDAEENNIISYFYDSKFYDRDAFVSSIATPKEKTDESKLLIKKNIPKKEDN